MNRPPPRRRADRLAAAVARLEADRKALVEVRTLLAKADERRFREPEEERKWNRVLTNLERSLDLTKARCERSELELARLEAGLSTRRCEAGGGEQSDAEAIAPVAEVDDTWNDTVHQMEALNLEEASELQAKIDAGEVHDDQIEAGLALANQRHAAEPEPEGAESRRQLVLRRAIEKIKRQQFGSMTLDEIKVVLACHSLLTSRLEPTSRDQRLRRIMDGAIKILQRKKAELEGTG